MDRWDAGFIALGLLSLASIVLLGAEPDSAFAIVVGVLGFVAAAIAANHAIARVPKLEVSYRSVHAGDQAVVWPARLHPPPSLHVFVRNIGRGPAESVEVRFDGIGASVFNESGNINLDVDQNLHPLRFTRPGQVLNRDEEWCMGQLMWHGDAEPRYGTAAWQTFARGMKATEGVVLIRKRDKPPA